MTHGQLKGPIDKLMTEPSTVSTCTKLTCSSYGNHGKSDLQLDYKIAYKSTFEPLTGLRHFSGWIRLFFCFANSCRRFVVWLCTDPFRDHFCSPLKIIWRICGKHGLITNRLSYGRAIESLGNEIAASMSSSLNPPRPPGPFHWLI